jgi:hypothetical protein
MEKPKFWFLDYKLQKDSTLSLINGLALQIALGIEEDSNRCQSMPINEGNFCIGSGIIFWHLYGNIS